MLSSVLVATPKTPPHYKTHPHTKTKDEMFVSTHTEQPKRFRMVALDLDGTLLQSNGEISQASVEYLRSLHSRGIIIVLASGRSPQTMYKHLYRLGSLGHREYSNGMPMVCSNGAEGLFCRTEEKEKKLRVKIHRHFYNPVSKTVAMSVLELADKLGLVSQFFLEDGIYANPSKERHFKLIKAYTKMAGAKVNIVHDSFQSLLSQRKGRPMKMLVLCGKRDQNEALRTFEEELGSNATIITHGWFIEILHKDVNKGNGLRNMCSKLQVPMSECVAFGDGLNDIEFLQMAGRGVAMKNAQVCVKEIADCVLEHTNDDDGVIRELQQMEKLECLELNEYA